MDSRLKKPTTIVRLEHPVMTGIGIAFGFFLFWVIIAVLGSFAVMLTCAEVLSDAG